MEEQLRKKELQKTYFILLSLMIGGAALILGGQYAWASIQKQFIKASEKENIQAKPAEILKSSATENNNTIVTQTNNVREKPVEKPITKQEAVNLVNKYLQAKSEILSPPFDRELASEVLTGKALHDMIKPEGTIDWLIQNNAYYRYGTRKAEPLALFWSDNNQGELDVKIYEELYFYKNNKLAKSNKYSGDFNFKFQKENGVWKIHDKSSKK